MFTVRRWWDRYGSQLFITILVLSTALFVRQTQGSAIAELYYWAVRPFQPRPLPEERLTNARVNELQTRLAELEEQNQTLQTLLGYSESPKQQGITAPIVGRSVDHWWKQVTLGRGSQARIKADYIVTAPGGLVGRVVHVTPHTSRILLISDPTSRVGVTISRSRQMGFMRGNGSDRAIMEFFDKVPDVKKGDKVITSTVSRLFPAGLPVGYVESVNLEKSPAPEVVIKLTAPLNYLEWAMVHPFKSK